MKARGLIADMPAKVAGYHARLEKLKRWYARDLRSGALTIKDLEKMALDHVHRVYDN